MRNLWLALALTLASCGTPDDTTDTETDVADADTDTDADSDADTDQDTDVTVECKDIPPDLCEESPRCKNIKAFPIAETEIPEDYCIDQSDLPKRVGCIAKSADCELGDAAPKYGKPPGAPDTTCFRILGKCIPQSWAQCVDALEAEDVCPE